MRSDLKGEYADIPNVKGHFSLSVNGIVFSIDDEGKVKKMRYDDLDYFFPDD